MCLHTVSHVCFICLLLSPISRSSTLTGSKMPEESGPPHAAYATKDGTNSSGVFAQPDDQHGFQLMATHTALEQNNFFVKKLFSYYGDGQMLSFEGFEHLLENLGLGGISIDHVTEKHQVNESFIEVHPHHNHTVQLTHEWLDEDHFQPCRKDDRKGQRHKRFTKQKKGIKEKDFTEMEGDNHHDREPDVDECLSPAAVLKLFDMNSEKDVGINSFNMLCPAIVYQLHHHSCSHIYHHQHGIETQLGWDIHNIPVKVWGYSISAVIIISLVGLLGVAIIPIMQKVFYNHLLQFLVALAVGALSGDALLHLFPHALQGDSHDHSSYNVINDDSHSDGIHKGLCGLLGIFFFFFMERILTIITHNKRSKKKKKISGRKLLRSPEDRTVAGARLSSKKADDCEDSVMVVHPNKAIKNLADDSHDQCLVEMSALNNHNNCHDTEESALSSHHHHGHSHLHGNKLPTSVASIAWMVILGDGIHNFSDGLAIGAAFSNGITGGISTSIAVFCHELPHEIGDFAVLLRAGMSAKQAVIYNCLSSILCLIGMLIGVTLGNISSASLWIFACIGGIFLYIALVDMLPEMTSVDTKQGENPFCHLIFQCFGMALGGGIMLVIALYEKNLKLALEP